MPAKKRKIGSQVKAETLEDYQGDMSVLQSSVTIDSAGDLRLLVGSEQETSLLISSKMLAMASDVFSAMFKPHFQERQVLAQSNPSKPYELALPDDNPASMIVLCNILHFRNTELPKLNDIDLSLLKNLAALCDKYNCASAVSFVSSTWLVSLASRAGEEGLEDYLTVAYLFDDPKAFKEASKQLVLNWADDFDELKEKIDSAERIPPTVYSALEKQRSTWRLRLEMGLQEPISGLLDKKQVTCSTFTSRSSMHIGHNIDHFCMHDTVKVSAYLRELSRFGLWPTSLRQRKLQDVLSKLLKFEGVGLGVALGFARDNHDELSAESYVFEIDRHITDERGSAGGGGPLLGLCSCRWNQI